MKDRLTSSINHWRFRIARWLDYEEPKGPFYYLSGPMTGYPEYNFPAFTRAAEYLRSRGLLIVSPHEVAHKDNGVPGSLSHGDYMRGDLMAMLSICTDIILMPGWQDSTGALLELHVAQRVGMKVWELKDNTLVRRSDLDQS